MFPIGYTFVFSFNDPFKNTPGWQGFTFDNWTGVCNNEAVCEAFGNSILIAVTATIFSTILGTMLAIAVTRYDFKFRSATNLLLFLPLATPEVVMGAGLAAQFFNVGIPRGIGPVIVGHILFTLSFVVVTVKARIATLDPKLEEAGRDLYAPPAQVFMKITFPLLLPGIMAAALLRRLHRYCFQLGHRNYLPEVCLRRSPARNSTGGKRYWFCSVHFCYCPGVGIPTRGSAKAQQARKTSQIGLEPHP
jgi:spermidine/putrescine transport system permease protein